MAFIRFFVFTVVVLIVCSVLEAVNIPRTPWENKDVISAHYKMNSTELGKWITNEKYYYQSISGDIKLYDVRTNQTETVVSDDFLSNYSKIKDFTLTNDKKRVYIEYQIKYGDVEGALLDIEANAPIVRYNNITKYNWSPVANQAIYTYRGSNNIYLRHENQEEIQIVRSEIFSKEEEIKKLSQSKDGGKLLVDSFDNNGVTKLKLYRYGEMSDLSVQYAKEEEFYYTRSGTIQPTYYLRIFDVTAPFSSPVYIKAPIDIVGVDHRLGPNRWLNETHLLVIWANRRQNVATLQLCSVEGLCREVKRFEEPSGWIEYDTINLHCERNALICYFIYWVDEWKQIWKLDLQTGENAWASRGNFDVLQIYGFDEINKKIYYAATLPGDPAVKHIFSNEDCLSCGMMDDQGVSCEYADARFNKDFSLYAIQCLGPNVPYVKIIDTKSNHAIYDVEIDENARYYMERKLQPIIKYMNVTLADGSIGYAKLMIPPNIDETKKYPLMVYVYGGPQKSLVNKAYATDYGYHITTKLDVIYAIIDARGTPLKGKKLQFSVNNHLGDYEGEDQIYVTKWFQDKLPYVDRNRTGVWGHSYGGYMTLKIIEADDERVFQCGVSSAPVTNWALYHHIYTERYMGAPQNAERLAAYNKSSALNNIDNFRNHDLLLMHGSADDNVHFDHSYLLAKKLQEANILFDEMIYVDRNHRLHTAFFFNMIDRFFIRCLRLSKA